jgi:tetratricopeptide (TPR) repeat protein
VGLLALGGLGALLHLRAPKRAAAPAAASAQVRVRPSVAVLGFRPELARREDAWLSIAFGELVATELVIDERLRVTPGEAVGQALHELALAQPSPLTPDDLQRVQRRLGVAWVVAGTWGFEGAGRERKLRLEVELDDAVTGRALTRVVETGPETELLDLVSRVGGRLREALGLPAHVGGEREQLRAAQPAGTVAARLYAEGLERTRAWDTVVARDRLEEAVRLEPDFAFAHSALADVYLTLGFDNRAAEEAQRAIDLSRNPSQTDRLLFEARLRKAKREWPRAIEIYRSLFTFYPDDLDYGLQLARALTMGGKSAEALETVAALRKLPAPLRDDPQIDIREAHAHAKQGDWKGWRATNLRAIEKAKAIGARGMIADAQRAVGEASTYLGDYAAARAAYEDARRIWNELGDRRGVIRATDGLAELLRVQGDLDGALLQYQRSVAFYRAIGDEFNLAIHLGYSGEILHVQGRLDRAQQVLEEALSHMRGIGEKEGIGNETANLADILRDKGEVLGAEKGYREALVLLREVGMQSHVLAVDGDIAMVARQQGRLDEATRLSDECLTGLRKVSQPEFLLLYLPDAVGRLRELDRPAEARRVLDEGLKIAREQKAEKDLAALTLAGAQLQLDAGRVQAALEIAREQGSDGHDEPGVSSGDRRVTFGGEDPRAIALDLWARALLQLGKFAEAAKVAAQAIQQAEHGFKADQRLRASITLARAQAHTGACPGAERTLAAVDEEAARKHLLDLQLESGLARGEIALTCGHPDEARQRLAKVAEEARRLGFARLLRLATSPSSSRVSTRPPAP